MCATEILGQCIVTGKIVYKDGITQTGNRIAYSDWKAIYDKTYNTKL